MLRLQHTPDETAENGGVWLESGHKNFAKILQILPESAQYPPLNLAGEAHPSLKWASAP
jgi:hypothetical protein